MNNKDIIQAFLTSIKQQQNPLPPEEQSKLNQIGNILRENIDLGLEELDKFARKSSVLQVIYRNECANLQNAAAERQKNREIGIKITEDNFDKTLINLASICQATDSVNAAKAPEQKNILQKFLGIFNRQ
ncbi:hypothetical protein NG798_21885 [Ancylothrix sp. C2]|uniref:hypothetical protein n=1 Tax=Ancylothrix sp. D3o TaxID=2953691 RepID=UPI0021BB9837|nr:hypothetical protein [Ancylothrix sp. D3o]MCT7952448.1 hypothetical protein [Ancylothrix sp. D3o]